VLVKRALALLCAVHNPDFEGAGLFALGELYSTQVTEKTDGNCVMTIFPVRSSCGLLSTVWVEYLCAKTECSTY